MALVRNRTIKQQITIILIMVLIGPTAAILMNILFSQQVDDLVVAEKEAELEKSLTSLPEQLKSEGLDRAENLTNREDITDRFKKSVQSSLTRNPSLRIGYFLLAKRISLFAMTEPENRNSVVIKYTEGEPPPPRPHVKELPVRERNIIRRTVPIVHDNKVVGILWIEDKIISDITKFLFVKYFSLIVIIVSLVGGILGITLIIKNLLRQINTINEGIVKLQEDLGYRIPKVPGELGRVAQTVNQMAKELSEKKKLEEQLQRSERLAALGHLVSGIAHELRNPLSIMRATVQLMEEEIEKPEEINQYTGIIIEQADRQNRIIQELLDFAKPSPPQLGPVDLNQLLDSVLTFTRAYLKNSNIELQVDKEKGLPKVLADGEKIKQVIINLIINGAQAMTEGGRLEIETRSDGNKAVIQFTDTGEGIAEENLENIFNPFFTTRDTGTGLGLAISHQIIKMHGGTIEVKSKIGEGTTFIVAIPIIKGEGDLDV